MNKILHIASVLAVLSLIFLNPLLAQEVLINEFMAANNSTLQDRDGDYPDWIELYNPGNQSVNLHTYGLSDDVGEARKWLFPEIHLPAGGFLVIFASGKDLKDSKELHTNFKISSSGEELILTRPEGLVVDLTSRIELSDDRVFVRYPDGADRWVESSMPTPGYTNAADNHLFFSHEGGFYNEPFILSISSLFGDSIYYTFDGRIPDESSALYEGPISLSQLKGKPYYFSSIPSSAKQEDQSYKAWENPGSEADLINIIRCVSYANGKASSQVYSKSYIVDPYVSEKFSMPILSLISQEENLFSYDSGIYVPGRMEEAERKGKTGNFFQRGEEWERPVHIEWFEPDGTLGFEQDAGVRIHGGLTRHAAQKSLRLYARNEYGKKFFKYQLLPQKQLTSYKRFLLRSSMGGSTVDNSIIRDVLAHELVRDLDVDIQDFRPVLVYINGEYWGIHTLRDRIDKYYIEYLHDCDMDSLDIINAKIQQVDAGSNQHYLELAQFIDENDLSISQNYEWVASRIDVSNFTDYVIAEMFLANWDWPGNNQKLWRPQTQDGKWRWIFYDLDIAYYDLPNIFEYTIREEGEQTWNEEAASSFLLRNLLKNMDYKNLFIARFREILKEDFSMERILPKAEMIMDLYRPEIPGHSRRWHYPSNLRSWEKDIFENLLAFLAERPCQISKQLADYLNLEESDSFCVSFDNIDRSIVVAPNPNEGSFYVWNNENSTFRVNMVLIEATGRIVLKKSRINLFPQSRIQVDVPGISGGIYFLHIVADTISTVKPIVIINPSANR